MQHEIKLQPQYYYKLKQGTKIYEVRLFDEKRQKFKVGDTLKIYKEPNLIESFEASIVDLIKFPSFITMAKTLPANLIGLDGLSIKEIENLYYTFYSKSNEQKYGVLAIKLKI